MDSAPRCLRAPIALLVAALALSLVACSGSDAKAAKAAAPPGSKLTLIAGPVQVAAAGAPGTLSAADRDAIIATLRKYVVAATINPMHGKPVGNLAALFTPEAAATLAGPDRATVVDEGMPKAQGGVTATTPPVPLVALSDQLSAINLVGASLALDVRAKAKGGPVQVVRNGELVLKRDGDSWKIASYRLLVNRTGTGIPAPTTSSTEKSAP